MIMFHFSPTALSHHVFLPSIHPLKPYLLLQICVFYLFLFVHTHAPLLLQYSCLYPVECSQVNATKPECINLRLA